jgi:hypothetical protein
MSSLGGGASASAGGARGGGARDGGAQGRGAGTPARGGRDGDALGAEEGAPPGARRSTSSNRRRHAIGTLDPMGWSRICMRRRLATHSWRWPREDLTRRAPEV